MAGFKTADSMLGKCDDEILCPTVLLAEAYGEEDRQVMSTKKPAVFLNVIQVASQQWITMLLKKTPIVVGGDMVVIYWEGHDIIDSMRLQAIDALLKHGVMSQRSNNAYHASYAVGQEGWQRLTTKEQECLFFLL